MGKFKLYRGTHRRRNLLITAGAVLVLLLMIVRLSVAPLLKRELISTVEKRLNARLVIGDLSYNPPYGVTARDCQLIALESSGEADLLDVQELSIRLAALPLLGGPLVVEDLTIRGPAAHLVRTRDGFAGQNGLVRPDNDSQPNDKKFSDLLCLRHLNVEDGQVVYEDRRFGNPPPAVWSKLNFKINTSPNGPADYGFSIVANNLSMAELQADGSCNIDDLTASLDHFLLKAQAGEEGMSQLPPEIQQILDRYRVRGTVDIEGSARGDAKHPAQNSFVSTITLKDGSAFLPVARMKLNDLHLKILTAADGQGASVVLQNCAARSGNGLFTLKDGARFDIDASRWTWSVQNVDAMLARAPGTDTVSDDGLKVTGSAHFTAGLKGPISATADLKDAAGGAELFLRNLSLQAPTFPLPVSNIDGPPIRFANGILVLRDLQAHYGGDQFLLSSLRLSLGQIAHGIARCTDLNGLLVFHPPNSNYPAPLDVAFKKVQPGGEFVFSGHAALDRSRPSPLDYDFLLSCDNGTLAVMDPRFDIFQIKFDMEATPQMATIPNFACHVLDGQLNIRDARFAVASPNAFSANLFIDKVSLPKTVALALRSKAKELNLEGLADIHTSIAGRAGGGVKDLIDSLAAEGQLELYGSNLWDIPAMQKIMAKSSIARAALTIGQAAVLFRVKDRVIEMQEAAVTAPAAGVHGHGTIGFDGKLDIYAIVALLGNWRDRLNHSDFAFLADIAGSVQKTLDKTTENLLYREHVFGPAGNPTITSEAGGEVKDAAQDVTNMLKHTDDDRPMTLLDQGGKPQ